jgi:hypothetical protein
MQTNLYENAEREIFSSRAKLQQAIGSLYDEGITFVYINDGKVDFRPEIKIHGNCEVFLKCFAEDGRIICKNYKLEEAVYEIISFD